MSLAVVEQLVGTLQQQRTGGGDGEHDGPAQGQVVGQDADLSVGSGHQESGSNDQRQGNDGDSDLNRDVLHDNVLLKKLYVMCLFFLCFGVLSSCCLYSRINNRKSKAVLCYNGC